MVAHASGAVAHAWGVAAHAAGRRPHMRRLRREAPHLGVCQAKELV
jgi:hypothetical protein